MIKKLKNLIDYFKFIKNQMSCLLFKFGLKKEVDAEFKNSTKKIKDVKLLNKIMSCMPSIMPEAVEDYTQFYYELFSFKEVVEWEGLNIVNLYSEEYDFIKAPFFEFYLPGHYNSVKIDYKNRTVIDIGSFIGDTALYFASQGAEVYGFEPVKKNYDFSFKLKELNPGIKDKLYFYNYGVSDKRGNLTIDTMNSTNDYRNSTDSYDVDIITLEDILNDYNIKPDILKIDCEGCEYNIILNTDLSMFNDIIFEHHAIYVKKDYNILIDELSKQGFKIRKLKDSHSNFEELGLIHAYK